MKKTFINAATLSIAGTAAIAPGWVAVTADVDDEMMGVKPSWKLPMLRLSLTTLKLFLVPERKIDIEQELKRHHCLKLRRTSMTDCVVSSIYKFDSEIHHQSRYVGSRKWRFVSSDIVE